MTGRLDGRNDSSLSIRVRVCGGLRPKGGRGEKTTWMRRNTLPVCSRGALKPGRLETRANGAAGRSQKGSASRHGRKERKDREVEMMEEGEGEGKGEG